MEIIKNKARELGFSFCGIAPARLLSELQGYHADFIARKHYTHMSYIERYAAERIDPSLLLPGVRSVIAVLLNYYPEKLMETEDNFIISKYAYGREYRSVMNRRLNQLTGFISTLGEGAEAKAFSDSGPVLEKAWAERCGVGWQGKHTVLLNRNAGSFFFIGIILTNLELDHDMPETDHCGTCTRCMDACPTGAITAPYELDPALCITYHTNVLDTEIPAEIVEKMDKSIFGCDICQDVCPYNRFSTPTAVEEFRPPEELMGMGKQDWMDLTEEEFKRIFRHSSLYKVGFAKIKSTINLLSSK